MKRFCFLMLIIWILFSSIIVNSEGNNSNIFTYDISDGYAAINGFISDKSYTEIEKSAEKIGFHFNRVDTKESIHTVDISKYTESELYHVEKIINTNYGTVLYYWPIGAPHGGKSPSLILIKSDGSEINLSMPVARETLYNLPEHENIVLSEDGKTLTFSVSFNEKSQGNVGNSLVVLHDAGTYYYTANLETGETIETSFEPLDIISEDVISSWAKPEVEKAIALGFVPISLRENYKRNITRAEFTKMAMFFLSVQYGYQPEHIIRTDYNSDKDFSMGDFLSAYCSVKKDRNGKNFINVNTGEAWKYEDKRKYDPQIMFGETPFVDLNASNIFDAQLVGNAYNFGIINGISENEFNPEKEMTRQEGAALLMRVYKNYAEYKGGILDSEYADDSQISDWAKEDVYNIKELGVMHGAGNNIFAPFESYTVEQAIATFFRLYESAPISRKNKNIKPLLDYQLEKEIYYAEISEDISFVIEEELIFDEYSVVSGTWWRRHRQPDHKVYVFYKYGGMKDLTSFVPISQDNADPIQEMEVSSDEHVIKFIATIGDSFRLYNQMNGSEKVYTMGKYKFEINLETGNVCRLEKLN